MVYLLSWNLIDWPRYVWHGHLQFPAATHHAVSDVRDADYVRWGARSHDGRACEAFHNPYAVPEECLTERAKAATDTVVDLLVAIYKARTGAAAAGRQASLFSPSGDEAAAWLAFAHEHLESVATPPVLPATPASAPRRPDVFVGAQALGGDHTLGAGLWGAKLFLGLTTPFVLGLTGGVAYARADGVDQIVAGTNLALLLPLVRRFTIGAAPLGVRLVCDVRSESCLADAVAGLGVLLIPLGDATWLGVEGPSWSWTERAIGRTWAGLSFGWSHERVDRHDRPALDALATWDPPRVEDVHAFRSARSTRTVYMAATAISQPENTFAGFGLEWRWDRDVWNRRAGVAPGVQLEIDGGRIDGPSPGGGAAVAPLLRAYLLPNRLAVTATPALVRVGRSRGRRSAPMSRPAPASRSKWAGWISSSIRRRCPTCRPRAGTRCRSPSGWACASIERARAGEPDQKSHTPRAISAAANGISTTRASSASFSRTSRPIGAVVQGAAPPARARRHAMNVSIGRSSANTVANKPSFT